MTRFESLSALSDVISEVQIGLYRHFGVPRVFLGGGSSRVILKHIYFDHALDMRDVDIFAVVNRTVDRDFARNVGIMLDSTTLGTFSHADLRPRVRACAFDPLQPRYIAGYGFFWKQGLREIDLSLFHFQRDLDLNGLLDIDTVMIPLSFEESLVERAKALLFCADYNFARDFGFLYDRFDGFIRHLTNDARLVNRLCLAADPIQGTLRIVRTVIKMGNSSLSPSLTLALKDGLACNTSFSRLQAMRNFIKLLADKEAPQELTIVHQLGIFASWLPPFDRLMRRLTPGDLEEVLASPMHNIEDGYPRLLVLLGLMPPSDRGIVLKELAELRMSPATLSAFLSKAIAHSRSECNGHASNAREDVDIVVNFEPIPSV